MSPLEYSKYYAHLTGHEKKFAPKNIFWNGDFSLLTEGRRVSVIGSRLASNNGLKRANIVVKALVGHNIIVVSGLASGIDTMAHKTAIVAGGKTIAVLPTSINVPYPKSNIDLFNEIKKSHLALSQFDASTPLLKQNFPIRNRTMALISDATIIIEASENSGTKYQGWEALKLGREVYLLENVVNDKSIRWAEKMLNCGAQILSRNNLEDVIYDIPYLTSKVVYDF